MKLVIVLILLLCACAEPRKADMPVNKAPLSAAVPETAEEHFEGTIEAENAEVGSKSEGETWLVLVVGTERFELENAGDLKAGDKVALRARRVTLSPYSAHRPGPRLQIVAVESR